MCVLYFFYGILFSSDADFFRKATNGRACFFDRPFCSSKERWALRLRVIELHSMAMACNWSSAMAMSAGFIRGRIWRNSPLESLKSNVGASLLAMRPGQSTHMLNERPSRASSLPQVTGPATR